MREGDLLANDTVFNEIFFKTILLASNAESLWVSDALQCATFLRNHYGFVVSFGSWFQDLKVLKKQISFEMGCFAPRLYCFQRWDPDDMSVIKRLSTIRPTLTRQSSLLGAHVGVNMEERRTLSRQTENIPVPTNQRNFHRKYLFLSSIFSQMFRLCLDWEPLRSHSADEEMQAAKTRVIWTLGRLNFEGNIWMDTKKWQVVEI